MAIVDLVMPKMGESIMEATILKWHKKRGDSVQMDETLLEIATDKVDSEVPSTAEGTIEEVLYNVNDVVPIGAVIARINTGGADQGSSSQNQFSHQEAEKFQPSFQQLNSQQENVQAVRQETQQQSTAGGNKFYSPLVLNIAAQEGISLSELEKINGSGGEGRVTKKDILEYVNQRKKGKVQDQSIHIPERQQPAPAVQR
ncbi:MAG TPA: biotin/lipoyl-containing protein, partial [Flavisolibacter sp.]|nr:biotin/lipoyl-containing protein [Flavisolibacter sp.]